MTSPAAEAGAIPSGRRSRAGQALMAIWVLVLVLLAAGAVWLQVLGPPGSGAPPARRAAAAPAASGTAAVGAAALVPAPAPKAASASQPQPKSVAPANSVTVATPERGVAKSPK